MKPKHQRLFLVLTSVLFLCSATLLVMKSFRSNLVYFYTPTELLHSAHPPAGEMIRVGGIVKMKSLLLMKDGTIRFLLDDGDNAIYVHYVGILPSLFRVGQGVVVEGVMMDANNLQAKQILTKHDEQYMPKEVVDTLKKSGYWQKQYGQ